jgi:hypothetical protein
MADPRSIRRDRAAVPAVISGDAWSHVRDQVTGGTVARAQAPDVFGEIGKLVTNRKAAGPVGEHRPAGILEPVHPRCVHPERPGIVGPQGAILDPAMLEEVVKKRPRSTTPRRAAWTRGPAPRDASGNRSRAPARARAPATPPPTRKSAALPRWRWSIAPGAVYRDRPSAFDRAEATPSTRLAHRPPRTPASSPPGQCGPPARAPHRRNTPLPAGLRRSAARCRSCWPALHSWSATARPCVDRRSAGTSRVCDCRRGRAAR